MGKVQKTPAKVNWRKRVQKAINAGSFTKGDIEAAISWFTCPVAMAMLDHPVEIPHRVWPLTKAVSPEPEDIILRELGYSFAAAVSGGNVWLAGRLLDQIDAQVRVVVERFKQ